MINSNIPRLMSIPEIAKTGLLPEHALRRMVKNGEIPAVYSGSKAFINFDNLCKKLSKMGADDNDDSPIETVDTIKEAAQIEIITVPWDPETFNKYTKYVEQHCKK